MSISPDKKSALLDKIHTAINATEKEIVRLEELTKPIAPDVAIGRISRMDAINNKSVSEAALRSARSKLASLHSAKSRIDEPDFGTCQRCHQPIRPARLMYMPESARCVHCADK